MRIGSSKSSIGVWVTAGMLVAAGGAWGQPRLPVVHADAKAEVSTTAILKAVINYSSVAVTSSPTSAAKAAKSLTPDEYHAHMNDPRVPWVEKCKLILQHKSFTGIKIVYGGRLDGTLESAKSVLSARLYCNDVATPFSFDIPTDFTVAAAAHSDTAAGQSFDTNMDSISGTASDVPGFASISLIGGTSNGFNSPGHISLIPTDSDGTYVVDSTFTIGYRISYVGSEDGPLAGGSGTLEGVAVMKAYGR
jgi:hypothetical protein